MANPIAQIPGGESNIWETGPQEICTDPNKNDPTQALGANRIGMRLTLPKETFVYP